MGKKTSEIAKKVAAKFHASKDKKVAETAAPAIGADNAAAHAGVEHPVLKSSLAHEYHKRRQGLHK